MYALYWAKKITTKVLNSKNSKILLPYRQLLNLCNKIKWKRNDKYASLSNLNIHFARKKIKKSYKSSRIAAPTWNEKFESPCGSYSLPDIQDYFKCIIKKHEKETENFPIRTYIK